MEQLQLPFYAMDPIQVQYAIQMVKLMQKES